MSAPGSIVAGSAGVGRVAHPRGSTGDHGRAGADRRVREGRSGIRLVGLLFIVALRPGRVEAFQQCSFDTLAHSDTITVTFSLMPDLLSSSDSLDRLAYLYYAQTIGEHFSAPKALTLAYMPTKHASVNPSMDDFGLGGRLQFKLDSHGRLKRPIAAATTAPELNEALARALIQADSAHELSPPPKTPAFADGLVELRVYSTPQRWPMAVPLMRAKVRVLSIDVPPQLKSAEPPKYPLIAKAAGLPGRVVLRFVIGENGRVIPSTVQTVEAEYREFIDASVESILSAKFEPAQISGCPVPMQIEQGLAFKIGEPEPPHSTVGTTDRPIH
ncbi:MAG TPA: energy transducer TonB [Gemmatimonadales bacterium]|jgi:TonB family protein